jgi:hypothetical protein
LIGSPYGVTQGDVNCSNWESRVDQVEQVDQVERVGQVEQVGQVKQVDRVRAGRSGPRIGSEPTDPIDPP